MPEKITTDSSTATPPEQPDPAARALDEPHLSGGDLESEIGDSEAWDEATEDPEEATTAGGD